MAKIIKKITFMIFVFIIILSAKVYANELTIECQESINPETENTLECIVKGNFTDNVNSIKVRYTLPEGVEFEGFIPKENWNLEQGGTKETTGFILRINEGDVTGQVEFGKFVFKVPSIYNKGDINIKLYELDATNTSCEIVDFDNIDVIKNIKIVKEDDDTSNKDENGNDENDKPSDDKNETDDGKDENDGDIEAPKDDNNSEGDLGINNNSNTNQSEFENDMSTNQGNKENINSSNINNNNIDKTPSKTPFGQYGDSNIIIILLLVAATIGFIVHKKLKKIKFIK